MPEPLIKQQSILERSEHIYNNTEANMSDRSVSSRESLHSSDSDSNDGSKVKKKNKRNQNADREKRRPSGESNRAKSRERTHSREATRNRSRSREATRDRSHSREGRKQNNSRSRSRSRSRSVKSKSRSRSRSSSRESRKSKHSEKRKIIEEKGKKGKSRSKSRDRSSSNEVKENGGGMKDRKKGHKRNESEGSEGSKKSGSGKGGKHGSGQKKRQSDGSGSESDEDKGKKDRRRKSVRREDSRESQRSSRSHRKDGSFDREKDDLKDLKVKTGGGHVRRPSMDVRKAQQDGKHGSRSSTDRQSSKESQEGDRRRVKEGRSEGRRGDREERSTRGPNLVITEPENQVDEDLESYEARNHHGGSKVRKDGNQFQSHQNLSSKGGQSDDDDNVRGGGAGKSGGQGNKAPDQYYTPKLVRKGKEYGYKSQGDGLNDIGEDLDGNFVNDLENSRRKSRSSIIPTLGNGEGDSGKKPMTKMGSFQDFRPLSHSKSTQRMATSKGRKVWHDCSWCCWWCCCCIVVVVSFDGEDMVIVRSNGDDN